ncbi:MAG: undecaprenyldiphospho-muramoylpentapeptide beta-N-acetylglucosaminyltransferase [Candidatus Eisenbacteria bacterium]
MRVLMAGGGTGGHLYPAVAVAQELIAKDSTIEVCFLGSRRKNEADIVKGCGFRFKPISATGMPRRLGLGTIIFFVRGVASVFEVLVFLLRWKPDVILGTGGYVSGPAIVIGWLLRIPCMIQEQNSIPGLTNRFLSRLAREVHLTFSESRRYFKRKDNLRLTGNPIRREITGGDRESTLRKLGLSPDRATVLVLGGSRGAHSINLAIVGALNKLAQRRDVQFLVQTGTEDCEWVQHSVAPFKDRVYVLPYFNWIGDAYCSADLVICRAGAMTVSEVAACGLPAVFVPYPHAVYDHQVQNARNLVERGAAEMILDRELNADILATTIVRLIADEARLKRMAINARSFARLDTAERIAKSLMELGTQA